MPGAWFAIVQKSFKATLRSFHFRKSSVLPRLYFHHNMFRRPFRVHYNICFYLPFRVIKIAFKPASIMQRAVCEIHGKHIQTSEAFQRFQASSDCMPGVYELDRREFPASFSRRIYPRRCRRPRPSPLPSSPSSPLRRPVGK